MVNSWGKLTKHKFFSKSDGLLPSLPGTQKMNKRSFISFIKRYKHIIVKPSKGLGGAGVIQITTVRENTYQVHYGQHKKKIKGLIPTYSFVQSKVKGVYVVQQKIQLAKINGRPFDLRVMVQRRKKSDWVITGVLAKIAGSGFFITNIVRSKGKALPLQTAIRQSNIHNHSYRQINNDIKRIALQTVDCLQKHYAIRTVGIDMGVDTQGKVWIIEANLSPDKTYFLRLKDKSMYRRMMSFYNKK